jgi:hypothetical protein
MSGENGRKKCWNPNTDESAAEKERGQASYDYTTRDMGSSILVVFSLVTRVSHQLPASESGPLSIAVHYSLRENERNRQDKQITDS